MTCQWCIYYRRRGQGICISPDRDGTTIPAKSRSVCEQFEPRRNCSTCEFRCSQDDRESSGGRFGECYRWKLRSLSTWGGVRKGRGCSVKPISGSLESSTESIKQGDKP